MSCNSTTLSLEQHQRCEPAYACIHITGCVRASGNSFPFGLALLHARIGSNYVRLYDRFPPRAAVHRSL